MLKIQLPLLRPDEAPVCFSEAQVVGHDAESAATWFTTAPVIPIGLALQDHIEFATCLALEQARRRRRARHYDPTTGAAGGADESSDEEDEEDDGEEGDGEEGLGAEGGRSAAREQTSARRKKFVKLTDEDLHEDWYALLHLPQQEAATEEQVRTAYRRRCLETHPDKQSNHSDELFKKVQRAFDILGDAETRRSYDSARPFDDSIPGELVEEKDFYRTFGPVFERNKKWSVDAHLPSLGTETTPYETVMRFYDRWSTFQTWRDFSHVAELEEIDEGMCREEKRFYMRENERQLAALRRDEMKRVRSLIERARKNDPRLLKHRVLQEQKRLQEQAERDAFREQMRAEQERRREAQEQQARLQKEEELRRKQEVRNTIRQAAQDVARFLAEHDLLDEVATNKLLRRAVRRPNIQWLFSKLTGAEEALEAVRCITTASTTPVSMDAATKDAPSAAKEEEEEEEGECGEADGAEDTSRLVVPAVRMFNRLVLRREQMLGLTRYGEAVKRAKANEASSSPTQSGPSSPNTRHAPTAEAVVWTDDDLHRLQKATAKYPPGTIERWSKIAAALRNRFTPEQAMSKVNEITAALQAASSSTHAHGANTPIGGTTAAAAATTIAPTAASATAVEDWTVKQQKQLELGLRELKEYKEKDKFQKIAKMVEGKTAKECFERFRYLCSVNKRK